MKTIGERHIVQGKESGFFGERPHILTYTPGSIFEVLLPFLAPHLTVCNAAHIWLKHVAWVAYAVILAGILTSIAFPDTDMGGKDGIIAACAPMENSKVNLQMCELNMTMMFWKGEFRFLIAFILAGFVGMTVKTWMARRTMYASLCGNMRNLSLKIAAYIPIDKKKPELTATRKTLGRWLSLAFELAVLKSRGKMDSEEGRHYLMTSGLMLDGEWEAMVKGDRHSSCFWWVHIQVVRLERRGILHPVDVASISESVGDMRAKANDLMSSLDLDAPIGYTSLCGLLVTINLFIMSTWKGIEWAIWMRSFGWSLAKQPKFYFDLFSLFVWNLSYKALYDLAYLLHNPFGPRIIDVAHETIFRGLRTLAEELMEGESHIPPTMGIDASIDYTQTRFL